MAKNHECNLDHIEHYVKRCSPLARSLLKSLLSKDPDLRPTAIEALNHPWFSEEKQPLTNSLNMNRYFTGHEFRNQSMPHFFDNGVNKKLTGVSGTMLNQNRSPDAATPKSPI